MKKMRINPAFAVITIMLLGSFALFTACPTEPPVTTTGNDPAVTSVTITLDGNEVTEDIHASKGDTLVFEVDVEAEDNASQDVTWSISGNKESTTLSDGTLEIGLDEDDDAELLITATSVATPDKTDTVKVVVLSDNAPRVNSVTISAAGDAASVAKGATLQFTAVVDVENGAADTVTWEITSTGHAAGTGIDEDGLLTVDAAESEASITVKATPTQAGFASKAATKTVTVYAFGDDPVINSVTISTAGDADSVNKGDTLQFTAVVDAENGAATTVTWEITSTGHAAGTGIDEDGLLTVDAAETEASISVKATPTQAGFDDKAETKTLTVIDPLDRTNYALGRGANALVSRVSEWNQTALAENAFDGIRYEGSPVLHWQGQGDTVAREKPWIGVDLGAVYDLSYVIVVYHPNNADHDIMTAGVIQVEETEGVKPSSFVAENITDVDWQVVGKFYNPDRNSAITPDEWGYKNVIKLDPGTRGQFIRVKMQDPATGNALVNPPAWTMWPRVSSFEVYLNLPKGEEEPGILRSISKGTLSDGNITISPVFATAGATVTLTPKASNGYDYADNSLAVSPAQTLTDAGGGKWTFTMPDEDVTVTATFTVNPSPVMYIENFDDVKGRAWGWINDICNTTFGYWRLNGDSSATNAILDASQANFTAVMDGEENTRIIMMRPSATQVTNGHAVGRNFPEAWNISTRTTIRLRLRVTGTITFALALYNDGVPLYGYNSTTTEHANNGTGYEVSFTTPAVNTWEWIDIPLTSFVTAGLDPTAITGWGLRAKTRAAGGNIDYFIQYIRADD